MSRHCAAWLCQETATHWATTLHGWTRAMCDACACKARARGCTVEPFTTEFPEVAPTCAADDCPVDEEDPPALPAAEVERRAEWTRRNQVLVALIERWGRRPRPAWVPWAPVGIPEPMRAARAVEVEPVRVHAWCQR